MNEGRVNTNAFSPHDASSSASSSQQPLATITSVSSPIDDDEDEKKVTTIETTDGRTLYLKYLSVLGHGYSGRVYLVKFVKPRSIPNQTPIGVIEYNVLYALKKIEEEDDADMQEAAILQKLHHENIVQYVDCFVKNNSKKGLKALFILTEYCNAGSLSDLLGQSATLDPKDVIRFAEELVEAVDYLHQNKIIHRDIKPKNILFKRSDTIPAISISPNITPTSPTAITPISLANMSLKLCDFGFSRILDRTFAQSYKGTEKYLAPEIKRNSYYFTEADIWSLGVVIYQMVLGIDEDMLPQISVKAKENPEFVKKMLANVRAEYRKLADVAYHCCFIDSVQRPTAKEILQYLRGKRAKLRVVEVPQQKPADKIVWTIRNPEGKTFWTKSFGTDQQVPWLKFYDAYKNYLYAYKQEHTEADVMLGEAERRGLKKLLSVISSFQEDIEIVTCFSFDQAISIAGFPFDKHRLAGMDRLEVYTGETLPTATQEQNIIARKQYLEGILKFENLYLDPITHKVHNIEKHCVPVHLTLPKWKDLTVGEYQTVPVYGPSGKEKTFDAIECLTSEEAQSRMYVIGESGSGKTLLMRMVLTRLAEKAGGTLPSTSANGSPLSAATQPQNAFDFESEPIPIFIPVITLTETIAGEDMDTNKLVQIMLKASAGFLHLNYSTEVLAYLRYCFQKKNVVLIFDGIDEAGKRQHEIVKFILEMHKLGIKRILVSSRHALSEEFGFENPFADFHPALLSPLSPDLQIAIAQRRGFEFTELIKGLQSEPLSELGQSPLFLSMIIEYFKGNPKTVLPRKVDLFGKITNNLVEQFLSKKSLSLRQSIADSSMIHNFLKQLAKIVHEENKSAEFSEDDLEQTEVWIWLKPDIDAGLFPLILYNATTKKYRFSHLCFQEYYLSLVWIDSGALSAIRKKNTKSFFSLTAAASSMSKFDLDKEKIPAIILDPWLRETFFLAAGNMEPKEFDMVVDLILDMYPGFAVVKTLINRVVKERPMDEHRHAIEERVKNEQYLMLLIKALSEKNPQIRKQAVSVLIAKHKEIVNHTRKIIETTLFNEDAEIVSSAIRLLSALVDKGCPPPLPYLLSLAESAYCNENVIQAMIAVTRTSQEKDAVISKIMKLLQKEHWGIKGKIRLWAVNLVLKIANKGDTTVVRNSLLMLQNTTNTQYRYSAFKLLRDIPLPDNDMVIKRCIDLMAGGSEHDIEEAARILINVAQKATMWGYYVTCRLLGFIRFSSDEHLQIHSIQVLKHIAAPGDYRVIEFMLDMINDEERSDEIRNGCAEVLAAIGSKNKGVLKKVMSILLRGHWYSQEPAGKVLLGFVPASLTKVGAMLCRYVVEESEQVRIAALQTLEEFVMNDFFLEKVTEYDCLMKFVERCNMISLAPVSHGEAPLHPPSSATSTTMGIDTPRISPREGALDKIEKREESPLILLSENGSSKEEHAETYVVKQLINLTNTIQYKWIQEVSFKLLELKLKSFVKANSEGQAPNCHHSATSNEVKMILAYLVKAIQNTRRQTTVLELLVEIVNYWKKVLSNTKLSAYRDISHHIVENICCGKIRKFTNICLACEILCMIAEQCAGQPSILAAIFPEKSLIEVMETLLRTSSSSGTSYVPTSPVPSNTDSREKYKDLLVQLLDRVIEKGDKKVTESLILMIQKNEEELIEEELDKVTLIRVLHAINNDEKHVSHKVLTELASLCSHNNANLSNKAAHLFADLVTKNPRLFNAKEQAEFTIMTLGKFNNCLSSHMQHVRYSALTALAPVLKLKVCLESETIVNQLLKAGSIRKSDLQFSVSPKRSQLLGGSSPRRTASLQNFSFLTSTLSSTPLSTSQGTAIQSSPPLSSPPQSNNTTSLQPPRETSQLVNPSALHLPIVYIQKLVENISKKIMHLLLDDSESVRNAAVFILEATKGWFDNDVLMRLIDNNQTIKWHFSAIIRNIQQRRIAQPKWIPPVSFVQRLRKLIKMQQGVEIDFILMELLSMTES